MIPDMPEMLYNEYVTGERDYYEDNEDIAVIDDSNEWYNQYNDIDGSEADV